MFNSLQYAKILEESGLPRNQAEAHIQILSKIIGEDMATKEDILFLRRDARTEGGLLRKDMDLTVMGIRKDMESMRAELRQDMKIMRSEFRKDLEGLRKDMEALVADLRRDMEAMGVELRKDMEIMEANIRKDMTTMNSELRRDMERGFQRVDERFEKLEYKLVVKLGGLMVVLFGSSVAAIGLMIS